MVTVPTASSQGIGQARTNNLPNTFQNISATPENFGAQQGRDFQNLGQGLQQTTVFLKRVQEQEDKAKGYEAYTKASEQAREYLNDPEAGLYNTKGSNALGSYKKALKDFDDIYYKTSEGLSDGAKNRLNELWGVKRENLLENVSRHEVKERNDYKAQSEAALLETSVNDAIENYQNPVAIADSVAIGEVVIQDSMEGSPPEAIALKKELFKSKVHSGVINRMVIDDPLGAEQYYKKYKVQISGPEQVVLEKLIDAGSVRQAAQAATDQIVTKSGSLEEQLKAARDIKNPKIRDEVVTRVKTRYNEQQTILEERAKENKSEAWKTIVDTKNVDSIPIQQWAALDGATQKAMSDYVNRTRDPKTDIRKWKELSDLYASDPKEFAGVDMMDYINDLSPSDFKDFTEKQQKIANGDNVDSIKVRTYQQIANDRLQAVGIDTGSAGSSGDKKKSANFFRVLTDNISVFTEQNGKEPNNQQVEDIIDRMLIKGDTGVFSNDFAFNLELGQEFEITDIEDVPLGVRRKAIRALEDIGAQATEDNILKLVNEKLRNERQ